MELAEELPHFPWNYNACPPGRDKGDIKLLYQLTNSIMDLLSGLLLGRRDFFFFFALCFFNG